jgi:Flp pilus assembly pilin Flp
MPQAYPRPLDHPYSGSMRARAQGLTEYGLILTLVAFVAIVGLTMFGGALGDQLTSMLSGLGTSV